MDHSLGHKTISAHDTKVTAVCVVPWTPPTPQSQLVTIPTSAPAPPAFEALPSAILTEAEPSPKHRESPPAASLSSLLNPVVKMNDYALHNLPGPVMGYFASLDDMSGQHRHEIKQEKEDTAELESPALLAEELDDSQDEDYGAPAKKRRRRETVVSSGRNVPRQPSPFELSSPPSRPATSNRKVSHSLIERRRRERINECLAHLKRMVPQCREEGEKKVARARERGRRRGRKSEADEEGGEGRGGLHKLEILQGTIQYLEELEAKVTVLEEQNTKLHDKRRKAKPSFLSDSPDSSNSDLPQAQVPIAVQESLESLRPSDHHPLQFRTTSSDSSSTTTDADEATAELLLNLSTSPELRPVMF